MYMYEVPNTMLFPHTQTDTQRFPLRGASRSKCALKMPWKAVAAEVTPNRGPPCGPSS